MVAVTSKRSPQGHLVHTLDGKKPAACRHERGLKAHLEGFRVALILLLGLVTWGFAAYTVSAFGAPTLFLVASFTGIAAWTAALLYCTRSVKHGKG